MHFCGGISDHRRALTICTMAEPAVAIAAADVIDELEWPVVLKDLVECSDVMDINIGAHGETAAQILRIMAHDKARKLSMPVGQDPLILNPV